MRYQTSPNNKIILKADYILNMNRNRSSRIAASLSNKKEKDSLPIVKSPSKSKNINKPKKFFINALNNKKQQMKRKMQSKNKIYKLVE